MEFLVALLDRLQADAATTMSAAAADAYAATLQRYHGWLVSNTFSLALMLVPSREAFFEKLGCDGGAPATREAVGAYCAAFRGVLDGVQAFLQANDLDDPTKV